MLSAEISRYKSKLLTVLKNKTLCRIWDFPGIIHGLCMPAAAAGGALTCSLQSGVCPAAACSTAPAVSSCQQLELQHSLHRGHWTHKPAHACSLQWPVCRRQCSSTLHCTNNQQQELLTNSMHLIEHLISQCMFLVYAFVSVFASRYIWEEIRNRNPYSNIPLIFIPKCTKLQKFELVFTNLSKVFKKIETSSNRLTSH